MKLTTFAFVLAASLALAVSAGCSKDKPVAKPTPRADTTAVTTDNKTLEKVTGDQQVSPNLALSGDIVQMCGINVTAGATANPTFDYNKEDLHPDDRAVLDQLATCLMTGALKGRSVELIGRADPRGTEEYNLGLGSRRATSVSSYLQRLGVGQPQLGVTTRGALDASGTDEAGWAKDRRVDITLAK